MDDVLVGKVTISASLMKIHFQRFRNICPDTFTITQSCMFAILVIMWESLSSTLLLSTTAMSCSMHRINFDSGLDRLKTNNCDPPTQYPQKVTKTLMRYSPTNKHHKSICRPVDIAGIFKTKSWFFEHVTLIWTNLTCDILVSLLK